MDGKGTGQERLQKFGGANHYELTWLGLSGNGNGGKAHEINILPYGFNVLDRYFLKDHERQPWLMMGTHKNAINTSLKSLYIVFY
jgi:hypothetical protein